jgi:hypothetical protein
VINNTPLAIIPSNTDICANTRYAQLCSLIPIDDIHMLWFNSIFF